jgi:transposase
VYEKPLSAREPVGCIDEKPVVLHQEVRPPVAMQPGRVARRDVEYRRGETTMGSAASSPRRGGISTEVTNDRSSPEFADYLLDVAAGYPEADTIHLVMDNLSSHTRKVVVQRFGAEAGDWLWNRFTVHYTPKHGSWLNQAEIAISLFSRQCLGRRRIGDQASSHDPVELHAQAGSQEVWLHNYAVTVLVTPYGTSYAFMTGSGK